MLNMASKAQIRTRLSRLGLAPSPRSWLDSIAKSIPILSMLLTALLSFGNSSSDNPLPITPLEQVRTDVVNKINYERSNLSFLQPLSPDLDLHHSAQEVAQRNADTQSEGEVPDPQGNLVVLQMHMSYAETNANSIVSTFLNSPAHRVLLLADDYDAIGVGIAHHGTQAWVVVQFTVSG